MISERVINRWIEGYKQAWESNSPEDIRALFTEDADYRMEPYSDSWHGHDEIVEGWLKERDEPGAAQFDWAPLAITDELAIVQGTTIYRNGPSYSNLWVIRLAEDGRAQEFTEWFMEWP